MKLNKTTLNNGDKMNNWKDVPHLFANGKFKFTDDGETVWEIIEYEIAYKRMYAVTNQTDTDRVFMDDCTLIARKIEDMTDEEIISFFDAWNYRDDVDIPQLRKDIGFLIEDGISFNRALNLISIGVYPFDQSHFKDGTVVDLKAIK